VKLGHSCCYSFASYSKITCSKPGPRCIYCQGFFCEPVETNFSYVPCLRGCFILLEILASGDQNEGVEYTSRLFCVQTKHLSVFGKKLSSKIKKWYLFHLLSTSQYNSRSNPLVTPVAIRTWTISSIICSVFQVATDDAASGIRGVYIGFPFY
jgi:hypothetical protein